MKKILFASIFLLGLSCSEQVESKDIVSISIQQLDKEIALREQAWTKAVEEAKQAELKAAYLQGAVEMLKLKRDELIKQQIK